MPTYDYECEDCGLYDLWQRMSEEPHVVCPKCKGQCRRKIGSGSAVIFKGPGFYQTDYKAPPRPGQ